MRHFRFAVIAAAIMTCVSSTALAQDRAGAEALFQRGVALQKQNKWKEACEAFAASMKLDPSVGTQINLARCADHDGKTAEAWAAFRQAKALNAETPLAKRKANIESYVDAEIKRLEAVLPWMKIVVRVAGAAEKSGDRIEGLQVERDGVAAPVEGLGVEVPVDPGKHVVRASAPGYVDKEVEIEIAPSEKKEAVIELVRAPAQPSKPGPRPTTRLSPAEADASSGGESTLIAGLTIGSLGVGGLIAAAVTGGIAASDKSTVDDLAKGCRRQGDIIDCPPATEGEVKSAIDRGESLSLASTIALFAGGGLAVTGVILIGVGASDQGSTPDESSALTVTPVLGPGIAGMSMTGRF